MINTAVAIGLSLAAVTTALAGHVIAGTDTHHGVEADRSFITPQIDGRRLDIRFSQNNAAEPAVTARQFCRDNGFDAVVGFSIQPVTATRMIGDRKIQNGLGGSLHAFYAIRCTNTPDNSNVGLG